MSQKLYIAMVSFLLLMFPRLVAAQSWKSIIPLISKRSDVEKLLGKCADRYSCLYKRENENVLINYTTGNYCRSGNFNVSQNTVLAIAVYPVPAGSLTIKDMDLDWKKFVEEEDPELPGIKALHNSDEGLTIESNGVIVLGIYLAPSKKNKKTFACSNKSE